MTRAQLRGLAAVSVLIAGLAAAPAETDCPEQSQAPRCATEPAAEEPAPEETRPAPTQRPTTPPGQATEPASPSDGAGSAPGRTEDPQPDRGSDEPAPDADPDGAGPTSGGAGGSSGSSGSASTPQPPVATDDGTGAPIPAPPPDLGARRVLESRLVAGPGGLLLAVEVAESRAHGVDGGWTVTVTGHEPTTAVVDAHPRQPTGAVGLIVGRDGAGPIPGFTVVGQRSTTVYDADYLGILPMAAPTPSTITVTLFQ